jgi:hypothetical protein
VYGPGLTLWSCSVDRVACAYPEPLGEHFPCVYVYCFYRQKASWDVIVGVTICMACSFLFVFVDGALVPVLQVFVFGSFVFELSVLNV